jgi:hypothetical protein
MRANDWTALLCATTIILVSVSSAADARYWRHYGYHWYGRSWNGFRPNNDERQVEKQPSGTGPASDSPDQAGDFGAAIEQMIHACDGQVAELENMPLDAVAGTINPTPDQTDALDHIRSVALEASKSLAAVCPKNGSANIHERLKTLGRTLEAMADSLAQLRPAFARFYVLLDDEQKARLVAMPRSKNARTQPEDDSHSRQIQDVAQRRGSSDRDLYCQQWVAYLKRLAH